MAYDRSLPDHAADKVSRALHDVLSLTDDFGEKLRISLMASSVPLAIAGAVLAEQMRREGHECTQKQAMEHVFKLLETTTVDGAEAAWASLNPQ